MYNYLHNIDRHKIFDCCYTSNYDEKYSKVFPTISKHDVETISKYPDYEYKNIVEKLEKKFKVHNIALGSGSEDMILRINEYLNFNNARVGMVVPIFHRITETYEKPTVKIRVDKINTLSTYNIDTVWLQNPNLFSNTTHNTRELVKIIRDNRSKLFLIDESAIFTLANYDDCSLLKYTNTIPNIVILTSFSKMHGLSGMRASFISGNREVISAVKSRETTFPWTSLTVKYVDAVLSGKSDALMRVMRKRIDKHKRELTNIIIQNEELEVESSPTNCIFIRSAVYDLHQMFLKKELLTLNLSDDKLFRIRMTVHSSAQFHNRICRIVKSAISQPHV